MLTVDTSALVALASRREPHHERVRDALAADRGPYIVPAGILAEVAYMLSARAGRVALTAFLVDLDDGAYSLDCGDGDMPRIADLVERFGDLPLGFADAAVVACAERSGGRILSLDRRDLDIVARGTSLRIIP